VVRRLILGFVVIGAAAAGVFLYLELSPGQPVGHVNPAQISLEYGNQSYSGAQGSYCWSDVLGRGSCADYVGASLRKDIPSPVTVPQGSSVCFQVSGYSNPSNFHVSVAPAQGSSSNVIENDTSSCIVVTMTQGSYFLTVAGTWSGRDTSNVFELDVTTPFSGFLTGLALTCDHPLDSPGPPNRATVYQITSSHAVLCVSYARGSQGKTSFDFNLQSWVENGSQVGSLSNPCSIVQGEYRCPGFTVVPSLESAMFENSTEKVALAYTITASPSASGLYVFFLTPGNPIYLSFGHPPTTVFFTAWTSGTRLPAGVLPPSYDITGGTDIDVTLVPWA